jgi:hypothetical protein
MFQTFDDVNVFGEDLSYYDEITNIFIIIVIIGFGISFFVTFAGMTWLYSTEILTDKGMSLA